MWGLLKNVSPIFWFGWCWWWISYASSQFSWISSDLEPPVAQLFFALPTIDLFRSSLAPQRPQSEVGDCNSPVNDVISNAAPPVTTGGPEDLTAGPKHSACRNCSESIEPTPTDGLGNDESSVGEHCSVSPCLLKAFQFSFLLLFLLNF